MFLFVFVFVFVPVCFILFFSCSCNNLSTNLTFCSCVPYLVVVEIGVYPEVEVELEVPVVALVFKLFRAILEFRLIFSIWVLLILSPTSSSVAESSIVAMELSLSSLIVSVARDVPRWRCPWVEWSLFFSSFCSFSLTLLFIDFSVILLLCVCDLSLFKFGFRFGFRNSLTYISSFSKEYESDASSFPMSWKYSSDVIIGSLKYSENPTLSVGFAFSRLQMNLIKSCGIS